MASGGVAQTVQTHGARSCTPRKRKSTRYLLKSCCSTRTEEILNNLDERVQSSEAGGAGGGLTLASLKRVDAQWCRERDGDIATPHIVTERSASTASSTPAFDVAICGGTLGIIFATYLKLRGHSVAVIERASLRGRTQEWNISRKELNELCETGVLTHSEIEECIVSEFNPVRCGFNGRFELSVNDVLNIGVLPERLVHYVRQRFEHELGGSVFENTSITGVEVTSKSASVSIDDSSRPEISTRLVLDCMGHQSPIMRQVRNGKKPDGACLVVGSCSSGFDPNANTSGDLIYSCTDIVPQLNCQLFWEAFPAGGSGSSSRTTYMFNYLDPNADCPSLFDMLEEYWRLLPDYQGVQLDQLTPERVLFGWFPTWRDSPLTPGFDRVLQVADASGIQSPLSFGGFGALTRHLPRVGSGIDAALNADALTKSELAYINAYQPNMSAAWLFQRAMSVPKGSLPADRSFINRVLATNFSVMENLGNSVLYPFLQDVPRFGPLARTILGMTLQDPSLSIQVTRQLGIRNVLPWLQHFIAMAGYEASLRAIVPALRTLERLPSLDKRARYEIQMTQQNLKFGSGADYEAPTL